MHIKISFEIKTMNLRTRVLCWYVVPLVALLLSMHGVPGSGIYLHISARMCTGSACTCAGNGSQNILGHIYWCVGVNCQR